MLGGGGGWQLGSRGREITQERKDSRAREGKQGRGKGRSKEWEEAGVRKGDKDKKG